MDKISIILPFKENFSPSYAGAVSLYVEEINQKSSYKKNINVFGFTLFKKKFKTKYTNLNFKKPLFSSNQKNYINEFIQIEKKKPSILIEIHNRPLYLKQLVSKLERKYVFHFHNDPLSMNGSRSKTERIFMINNCERIIFCSGWVKQRFLEGINTDNIDDNNFIIINHSTNKKKVNFKKKENIITFVGRLNKAKGYDLFGEAAVKILDKYKNWKVFIAGDEPREKINFNHSRLFNHGFLKHNKILAIYEKTSIAVTCSRWEEPFGRTSLEASSRGCAVIISNRGGLKETVTNAVILKNLSVKELYDSIENLIIKKKKRTNLQKKSYKNFYLNHKYISLKTDKYRKEIFLNQSIDIDYDNIKILHITNFNYQHDGRLFYNTGKRLNNGFIKSNHAVLELSDRDTTHENRSIKDLDGTKLLNKKILNICNNFRPNLILLGHADKVKKETLIQIKKLYPEIKVAQWFLDPLSKYGPDYSKNKKRFLDKIDILDASFLTTHPSALSFLKKYRNCHYIPNPTDKSLDNLKIYKNKKPKNDIFFALSHGVHRGKLKRGKVDERINVLNKILMHKSITSDFYGINKKQPIWSDEFLNKLSNSKIGLNLSRGKSVKYYSSDRLAQLMGNGIATLININTKYNDFFTSNEMIFYKNENDLIQKILKFKNNKKLRTQIAMNGQKKYHRYFNNILVCNFMIKKIFNLKYTKKFLWEK